jgi:hypothetical protein
MLYIDMTNIDMNLYFLSIYLVYKMLFNTILFFDRSGILL